MDNREIKAIDFYEFKKVEQYCTECNSVDDLAVIKDGYDSVICSTCIHKTLRELNFKDDFENDDFKK